MSSKYRIHSVLAAVALTALTTAAVQVGDSSPSEAASRKTARELLRSLPVAPALSVDGFDADRFGRWGDVDGDCQRTDVEVLFRDGSDVAGKCNAKSGVWEPLLTSLTTSDVERLEATPVVPLREAWVSGARNWTKSQRKSFLNDLGYDQAVVVMLASDVKDRQGKDPSNWRRGNANQRCEYARAWVTVKWRWRLSINSSEKSALATMLSSGCGSERFTPPRRINGLPNPPTTTTTTTTTPTTTTGPPTPGNPGDSKNCGDFSSQYAAQVWFDSYYPYYGDVAGLDADNDGIACESL